MRTIIVNAKGFSLPEVMIGLGLMGGVSLVTMKMINDQSSNEAFIKGNTEIQKAVTVLKNTINDPENCRSILSGKSVAAGGTALTSLTIPVKHAPAGTFKEILAANTKYNGFETKDIRVVPGARPNTAQVELNFRIKNRNMNLWGSSNAASDPDDRIVTERIPLVVSQNGSTVTDCGPAVSEANATAKEKFCRSLGGAATWIAATSECTYNDMRCPYGKVLVKMTSLGGTICEDIKDHIKLDSLFDTTPCTNNGRFRIIDNGSGKLKIDCN